MLYISDSEDEDEMPTLDALLSRKRAPQQARAPGGPSLDPGRTEATTYQPASQSSSRSAEDRSEPAPPSSTLPLSAAPVDLTIPSAGPALLRAPLRPLSSARQPPSPCTPARTPRRRPQKGVTSAELLAQDERDGYHHSPAGAIRDEILIVEYRTDSEQETASSQGDATTEEETTSTEDESSSSSASSSDATDSSPPPRTRMRKVLVPAPTGTPSRVVGDTVRGTVNTAELPALGTPSRALVPAAGSQTPTQYPQSRYRPKGYATQEGYRLDPFFDPEAYVVLAQLGPANRKPSCPPGDDGSEPRATTKSDQQERSRAVERKKGREAGEREVVPATESEASSGSDEERRPDSQFKNPIPSIDLPSTPRQRSRRPRPTHLFGSYISTPPAKATRDQPLDPPVSPFIDLSNSPAQTPRRKRGKAPRPTELFQSYTRETPRPTPIACSTPSVGDHPSTSANVDVCSPSTESKPKKESRVDRRKSGRDCWIGEAVEEVRAIEHVFGDNEADTEGVLTMLDDETQAQTVGSPLPTCIASTSTLPIDSASALPSSTAATLTTFRGGRRMIVDSDDELNSPVSRSSVAQSPPPSIKGKECESIVHELSDSSASDSERPASFADPIDEDHWGGDAFVDPSSGVLSFSPPPRPALLPPSPHPIASSPPIRLPGSFPSTSPADSPVPPKSNRPRPRANVLPPPRAAPVKINSKAWKAHRAALALELVGDLDKAVFDRKVAKWLRLDEASPPRKNEPRGIEWTARLRTTAGMSRWCRKKCASAEGGYQHFCKIELSSKVLDTDEKILSTTAHELCHLATWIFDGKDAAPHGKEFKAYARRINRYRPDIVVTTRHDYEIQHKFTWKCAGCDATYGRDSRSIDPLRQCCGKCKGKLVHLHPEPSTATPSKPNPYRDFLKENFKSVQISSPGASQAEVMRLLGEKWRVEKQRREAAGAGTGGVDELTGGLKGLVIEVD